MRNSFTFNGVNSSDFGIYITGAGVYDTPVKRYDKVSIEGRNGDLILMENNRFPTFENITLRYPAILTEDFSDNYKDLKTFLSSTMGYAVLSDTIEPDRFRYGAFKAMSGLRMTNHMDAATFEILFDCKPQWYLLSGEDDITVSASGTVLNPTAQYSKPLIKVTGEGTIGINSQTVTVDNNTGRTVYIDSEIEDAYTGTENRNGDVTFSDGEFPILQPGENTITLDGVTLEIVPRWYEI